MDSILDLFLLALAKRGVSTYSLLRDARLSVGATHPALRRLERQDLLRRETAVARGKSVFRLTAAGRIALKKHLQEAIRRSLENPPSDTESALRVAFLAYQMGNRGQAKELLATAAKSRGQKATAIQQELPAGRQPRGEAKYLHWLRVCEAARLAAEAEVLRTLTA